VNSYIARATALLVLATVAAACQQSGQQRDAHGFSKDDYFIYKSAIDHAAQELTNGFIVTGLKTRPASWDQPYMSGFMTNAAQRIGAEYQTALNALFSVDTLRVDWRGLQSLGVEVVHPDTLRAASLRTIKSRMMWTQDYITLGPIGYDGPAGKAIVYLRWSCGTLCGYDGFLLFEHRGRGWEVVRWILLGVS
jgi:hypothetical protein